jgi:hypothetical protein
VLSAGRSKLVNGASRWLDAITGKIETANTSDKTRIFRAKLKQIDFLCIFFFLLVGGNGGFPVFRRSRFSLH